MFKGTLRDFQQECVDEMLDKEQLLVAAVMGAGKTVITIAACEELLDSGKVEYVIIVVPASVKYQWAEEIEEFAPNSDVTVVDGTAPQRAKQYERFRRMGDYLIINYEPLKNDLALTSTLPCDAMVCDEIQYAKNPKAARTKAVRRFRPRYRYGLTGQPVENKAEEIFQIMEWVKKGHLGSARLFDSVFIVRDGFGKVVTYQNMHTLHERLSERMFRRSYEDIEDQLPKVTEQSRLVEFTPAARGLYRTIGTELLSELEGLVGSDWSIDAEYGDSRDSGGDLGARGRVMAKVTCLRMLADHPQMLIDSANLRNDPDTKRGSAYAADLLERGLLDKTIAPRKYTEGLSTLKDLAEQGRKVVLFSFFKGVLGYFHTDLLAAGIDAEVYHGGLNAKAKHAALTRFRTDPAVSVLLASDAGKAGINIPEASVLMNYTIPWDNGTRQQRNARIRRLSSEFASVSVLNLMVNNSIDTRMYGMLKKKGEIAAAVVDGKADKTGSVVMDVGTLRDFLTATI